MVFSFVYSFCQNSLVDFHKLRFPFPTVFILFYLNKQVKDAKGKMHHA